jgi:multicomponent Na+:H+ antiporter subunit B
MIKKALIFFFIGVVAWFLLLAVADIPPLGSPNNPPQAHIAPRYLQKGVEEGGCKNIITAIVLNYRGYDTMGEVTVIFTALISVLAVLGRERRTSVSTIEESSVEPSPIVRMAIKILVPFIFLFAFYVILHGHTSPGGGFQGGAILGASLVVFTLIYSLKQATGEIPVRFRQSLESIAIITFALVGSLGIIFGANFLTYRLPGFSAAWQEHIREMMLILLEIGIGAGGGLVIISICFAMAKKGTKDAG